MPASDDIKRVAVLGAGVMGAQIAALAANTGLEVDLLDLPDGDGPAGRARDAIEGLATLRPPALYLPELSSHIHPGSLDDAGEALGQADWVIEAVVEDLEAKGRLLQRVTPLLGAHTVVSSNTSGLSIAALAECCNGDVRQRFLGVHFFNPPRYMKLVEVIPGPETDACVVTTMSDFVTHKLGKGVVPCLDTPNFIANRLGVFAIVDALHRMVATGLTVEEVDAVTGPVLGRPGSATLRLCDLIGLDTLLHVAATSYKRLAPHAGIERFAPPPPVRALVDGGRLGTKTGAGFYRKSTDGLEAMDLQALAYRPLETIDAGLPTRGSLGDRLAALWDRTDRLSLFAREHLVATLAYCAHCAAEVAHGLEDVDRALRWGFNWEAGPFEMVDLIGAQQVCDAVAAAGDDPPALLQDIARQQPARVYVESSADAGPQVLAPSGDGRRSMRATASPTDAELLIRAEILMEAEGMRLLYLGEGQAAVELRGKINTLPPDVLRHVQEAIENDAFEVLVLIGAAGNFSAGADLKYLAQLLDSSDWSGLEEYVELFQQTTSAVRYGLVPIVAAAQGLALGGGCELCLTAASRVVAGELRMGLVETKVGVIPGAGGCKEMARRFGANIESLFPTLQDGRMSDNALQARQWGFLDHGDAVQLDNERLLVPAFERSRELLASGWSTPEPAPIAVAGPETLARLEEQLAAGFAKGELLAHDVVVGGALARVLCGGGDAGPVSETRLLELERDEFLRLCGTPATRARIEHMLRTGKALRN
jgi:3-hydroxyacyl-CoA dehydrogenase